MHFKREINANNKLLKSVGNVSDIQEMTGENVDKVTIKNENTYQRRVQQLNKILNCGLKAKETLLPPHDDYQ